MSFSHDRRGQSVVVGTVILFGFLILAMATYQAQFVPTENGEVEFEHSQQVERDFLDLRNDVLSAGATGSARSTSIQLGTRYPQRTFFLNPPAASGTLVTTEERQFEIRNARIDVNDGAHENVRHFWNNGTERGTDGPVFDTRSIRYTPDYNEHRGAPRLVYENSLVAAEFDDRVLARSDQTVVRGDRVSLTTLSGVISENGVEATSVDSKTVSRGSTTVPISGDGGDVVIVLPTAVSNASDLVDRLDVPAAKDVTANGDRVEITLEETETYRLGLSEVSVDGDGETEPAYIVPVGGQEVTAGLSVGVEVRDEYNNPVSGADVGFAGDTYTTNDEGRTFFEPENSGNATINGTEGPNYESVRFEVAPADGGSSSEREYTVSWNDPGELAVGSERLDGTVESDGEPIDNATVDFATSDPSVAAFSEANTTTTTVNGEFTADVTAKRDGNATLFASSGDDVATIPVTITGADSVLEPGTVSSSDTELIFTMQNVGGTDVTIEEFAVDATGINTGITINDGNALELEIRDGTVEGRADRNGNPDSFDADGTRYDLEADSQGNQGQYATISPDDGDVTVDLRQFSERLDNGGSNPLRFTDSAVDADVTVTFVLSDGSEEELYLQRS